MAATGLLYLVRLGSIGSAPYVVRKYVDYVIHQNLYDSARNLATQPYPVIRRVLSELSDTDANVLELALTYDWHSLRRDKQIMPPGDWLWWLLSCGRGFGKTRASMELLRQFAEDGQDEYVAVIAATHLTIQRDLISGPSGIMAVSPPWFKPTYNQTKAELRWPVHPVTRVRMRATLMTGEKPDRIRGDEVSKALLDELPTWQNPYDAWMNVELILRRGSNRRGIITCTQKRTGIGSLFSRDLLWGPRNKDTGKRQQRSDMVIVQGATSENDALDIKTRDGYVNRFAGTADAITELDGGLPTEAEGALWTPETIDDFRVPSIPVGVTLVRSVIAVDPTRQRVGAGDLAGIIVGALGSDGHAYVYADKTLSASPERWMDEAVSTYTLWHCDYGIYEQNRLPEDYVTLLRTRANLHSQSWKPVTARKKKVERAEPVASLCRSGKVHHVGIMTELEEEQCGWDPHGNEKQESPNRIDAFVHLIRELLLSEVAQRKPLIVR